MRTKGLGGDLIEGCEPSVHVEEKDTLGDRVVELIDENKIPMIAGTTCALSFAVAVAQAVSDPALATGALVPGVVSGTVLALTCVLRTPSEGLRALALGGTCLMGTGALLYDDAVNAYYAGYNQEQARLAALPNQRSMTDLSNQTLGDVADCKLYDKARYVLVVQDGQQYAVYCDPAQRADAPTPNGQ